MLEKRKNGVMFALRFVWFQENVKFTFNNIKFNNVQWFSFWQKSMETNDVQCSWYLTTVTHYSSTCILVINYDCFNDWLLFLLWTSPTHSVFANLWKHKYFCYQSTWNQTKHKENKVACWNSTVACVCLNLWFCSTFCTDFLYNLLFCNFEDVYGQSC